MGKRTFKVIAVLAIIVMIVIIGIISIPIWTRDLNYIDNYWHKTK